MNEIRIRSRKGYTEVTNHRALNPNVQGETGVVFRPETIKKCVEEYIQLVEAAPYYRVMLDSHVDMSKAKWADVGGLLTDVWVDSEGSARINYTVFGNTAVEDRLKVLGKIPGLGAMSLSARGYGRKVKINPSRTVQPRTTKVIRMLSDSPIKYFKTLGDVQYKKGGVYIEDFILLGWDLVVAPSQNEASSLVLVGQRGDAAMVNEGGIIRKAFGDRDRLKNRIVTDLGGTADGEMGTPVLEASASMSLERSTAVPPLRSYILAGTEVGDLYSADVRDMLKTWV